MKTSLPQFLLFLALLILFTNQQCSLPSTNDLLQSGSNLIYNARANTREHIFTVTSSLNSGNSLQVAASVSTLSVSTVSGLDFSVRAASGPSYGTASIVLLINEDNSWTNIRVNYLLSQRTDFYLGFYVADIYLASKSSQSVNLRFPVNSWAASQLQHTITLQFSGIRTSSNSFSVSMSGLSFTPASGFISINVNINNGGPVEAIFFSFVIFSQNSGIIFSNFNPSIPSSSDNFIGLETISSSGSSFSGSSYSLASSSGISCIGGGCPSGCISSSICTSSGGQIFGANCIICSQGQVFVNGNCQSSVTCGANSYWSGSQCVCNNGYIMSGSICTIVCWANSYSSGNTCICYPGYTQSGNQCISTSITCGLNYVVVNGVCTCPYGFGLINNLCLRCPSNSVVNSRGYCQCNTGFNLDSSLLSCVSGCWPNSTPNAQGQCVCNDGYYNQGSQCISYGNCQNGMIYNGITCVCPTGQYVFVGTGTCSSCSGYGQGVSGTSCTCLSNFYPSGSSCIPCIANSVYDSAQRQCVCISGYTSINGQCVSSPNCPQGSTWNPSTNLCRCNIQGYYIINNVCSPCPTNSYWNGNTCQCNPNYVQSGSSCVPSCPSGSSWNGQSCICSFGFYLIGGTCVQCDPNSSYNNAQQTCVCNNGYYGTWQQCNRCGSSCLSCSSSSQCTSCPSGSNLNGNGVCVSGCSGSNYIDPNNLCKPCMANCVLCYSADSCTTCASGYSKSVSIVNGNIGIICTQAPTGTSSALSLKGYVVGNKVIYQGVAMSLMPTQILANGCSICDELLLVKYTSSSISDTIYAEFVTDSQYWFMITFDFSSLSMIPTFEFTVQINPIHATYFTALDMKQKLYMALSPNTLYQSANSLAPTPIKTIGGLKGSTTPVAQQRVYSQLSNTDVAKIFFTSN